MILSSYIVDIDHITEGRPWQVPILSKIEYHLIYIPFKIVNILLVSMLKPHISTYLSKGYIVEKLKVTYFGHGVRGSTALLV